MIDSVDSVNEQKKRRQFKSFVRGVASVFRPPNWTWVNAVLLRIASMSVPDQNQSSFQVGRCLSTTLTIFNQKRHVPGKNLITPCHGPSNSPALLVSKKNKNLRLVLDFCEPNKHTVNFFVDSIKCLLLMRFSISWEAAPTFQ